MCLQQLGKKNTGVHMICLCRAESWACSQRQFPSTGPLSRQTWPQKLGPCQPSTLMRLPGVLFWPPSEGSEILLSFKQHFSKWNVKVKYAYSYKKNKKKNNLFKMCFEEWNRWFNLLVFFYLVLQLLILKKSLVHTHTLTQTGISRQFWMRQASDLIPITRVFTLMNTHLHIPTHSDAHHFRGLFVKVEEAINGILLNHKTRAKFSPLHWQTTNPWLF